MYNSFHMKCSMPIMGTLKQIDMNFKITRNDVKIFLHLSGCKIKEKLCNFT